MVLCIFFPLSVISSNNWIRNFLKKCIFLCFQSNTQYGNCRKVLSQSFRKNSIKSTLSFLLRTAVRYIAVFTKFLSNESEFFVFPHCVAHIQNCNTFSQIAHRKLLYARAFQILLARVIAEST